MTDNIDIHSDCEGWYWVRIPSDLECSAAVVALYAHLTRHTWAGADHIGPYASAAEARPLLSAILDT